MTDTHIRNVIEAALLAAGAPVPLSEFGRQLLSVLVST